MKKWKRFFVLFLSLVAVNAVTWTIVEKNYHNNIYPVDGDSISIPLFLTIFYSIVVSFLFVAISLLPTAKFFKRICSRGRFWRCGMGTLLFALYLVAMLFAIGGAGYWSDPNHYWIALLYLFLFLELVIFLVLDMKDLCVLNPLDEVSPHSPDH